jgi:hypothetical protein
MRCEERKWWALPHGSSLAHCTCDAGKSLRAVVDTCGKQTEQELWALQQLVCCGYSQPHVSLLQACGVAAPPCVWTVARSAAAGCAGDTGTGLVGVWHAISQGGHLACHQHVFSTRWTR